MHPLFTTPVPADALALHWFGQSSFGLKTSGGTIVLIDPFFPLHRPPTEYRHVESPLDEATLPTNLVLITHDHRDHNCVESQQRLLQANRGTRFLAPPEALVRMRQARIPEALMMEAGAGQSRGFADIAVHAVHAKPPEGDPANDIPPPDVLHLGYVVVCGPHRIWFSGDPIHTFARHATLLDPVRAHAPTLGVLTMQAGEGEFPSFAESLDVIAALNLPAVVPAHYDCFVKRHYDVTLWANALHAAAPHVQAIVPDYNTTVML